MCAFCAPFLQTHGIFYPICILVVFGLSLRPHIKFLGEIVVRIILIVISFSLFGCASQSQQQIVEEFEKSATVEKSLDVVWEDLIRFLSINDIEIAVIEKDSGLISLSGENLSSDLIQTYCATKKPWGYTQTGGNASGTITVRDDDGFVTVEVNMRFTAISRYGANIYPQNCPSLGTFEAALLVSIR